MIRLLLNGQLCDLEGEETIASDYSISPFSNISGRSTTKSITFKIPTTANNLSIIENNNIVINDSQLPYTLIPAQLFVDGIDQKIFFAELAGTQDEIEVRLYGSNANFYAIIKNQKITELDLDAYNHVWNLTNVANLAGFRDDTQGYIYPLIDFHSDSPNIYCNNTDRQIDVRFMIMALFWHTLVREIVEQAGYTLAGDFITNQDYLDKVLQVVTLRPSNDFQESTQFDKTTTEPKDSEFISVPSGSPQSFGFAEYDNTVYDPLNLFIPRLLTFTITEPPFLPIPISKTLYSYLVILNGEYTFNVDFTVTINNSTTGPLRIRIAKIVSGIATPLGEAFIPFVTGTPGSTLSGVLNYQGDFVEGEYIIFYIDGDATDEFTMDYSEATLSNIAADEIEYGNTIRPQALLPNLKKSDIFKLTAQEFGLIIDVDEPNKVVYLRQFSEITDNIPNALDVSDRVDYSEKQGLSFRSEYAQNNLCTYEDDDTVRKPTNTDSAIIINNQNLPFENELFESPFAASEQVLRFIGNKVNQIKVWSTDFDASPVESTTEDVEYRVLIIERREAGGVFTLTDGSGSAVFGLSANLPFTRFINPEFDYNLGWGYLLPRFSPQIILMLQHYKAVGELLRLDPAFINQLDFFIPLWVKRNGQPGAYYYLSEVKKFEYTSKDSTNVDLVKLP